MTQGDKIRQMSDNEMVKMLGDILEVATECDCCPVKNYCSEHKDEFSYSTTCNEIVKSWLKSEVK